MPLMPPMDSPLSGDSDALAQIDPLYVRVGFERLASSGRWATKAWRACSVEPADPPASGGLANPGDDQRPDRTLAVQLHRDEAEGYFLNVGSDEPSFFVLWRLDADAADAEPWPLAVTLSYNEAGRWMDAGETVERVALAPEIVTWLAEYVRLHYRPEKGRKRRGAKPSFMPRDEFAALADRESRRPRES